MLKFPKTCKGFSSVIGAVFMVLVMMVMASGVFLWTLSQTTAYNLTVKEINQLDVERLNEKVLASNANYTVSAGVVYVNVTVFNKGSLPVRLVTLWVLDTTLRSYGFVDDLDIDLDSGQKIDLRGENAIAVVIPGADPSHNYNAWFITARGNAVPVEGQQSIIMANLAQGIGSVAMDFAQFRYYIVKDTSYGTDIGDPIYSFTIPSNKYTVFCVTLINLDPRRQTINLTSDSYIWAITPYSSTVKGDSWPIVKVENNKLAPFNYQLLPYGTPIKVYFGPHKPQFISGTVPIFILLFGTIGSSDYGQNIPFVALKIS